MKKALLLLVVLCLIIPSVLSIGYNRYAWQNFQGESNPESYLLRGIYWNPINRDTQDYFNCSLNILGKNDSNQVGDQDNINPRDYAVYPLYYYFPTETTENTYTSLMLVQNRNLIFISADCSILQNITINGTIISEPYISNSLPYSGFVYTMPKITILIDNEDVDHTLSILQYTLNSETSNFELTKTVDSTIEGYTLNDKTQVFGLVGGCTSNDITCNTNAETVFFMLGINTVTRVAGIHLYSWNFEDNVINDIPETFSANTNLSCGSNINILSYPPDSQAFNYLKRPLFFDDWDGDGENELMIGYVNSEYIPACVNQANYVQIMYFWAGDYNRDAATFTTHDSYAKILDSESTLGTIISQQPVYPCQIGEIDSVLEICVDVVRQNSWTIKAMYDHFMIDRYGYIQTDSLLRDNLIFDITDDGLLDYVINGEYYINVIDGSSFEENTSFTYTLDNANGVGYYDITDRRITAFNYNLYEDTVLGITSILYSNGDVYQLTTEQDAIRKTDWNGDITNSSNSSGYITAGDLNDDGEKEIIYYTGKKLWIHTNNPTAFTLQNMTPILYTGTVTTTTLYSGATTTTTLTGGIAAVDNIFEGLSNYILPICGLALILALAIMGGYYSKGNAIGFGLGGIIGATLSVMLGFITGTVLIIIIISLVLLVLLGFTLLKPSGN